MQQSKKPPARSEAKLSIGALSQATAIPVANLRTWERRYGFPVPEGKPSGQRLYPLSRVVRIFDTDRDLGDRPMKRWLTSTGLIGLLLLAALAPRAMAQCNCVVGDGRFTTHTGIVIDGNRADWAAVLADPDNNSCDGGAPNIPPQPDLDAPVQSTGRDLLQFVYTWDNTHVATLTDRVASSSNVQKFIYYADTNNNGWMETGERVVVATWQGSNRQVDLYLGWYSASQPGGDPMVSPVTGLGDGYRLPGQVTGLPSQGQPHYTGFW